MSKVQIGYDSEGYPNSVIMDGGVSVITAPVSSPKASTAKNDKQNPAGEVPPAFLEEVGKTNLWVPWGPGNDFPRELTAQIEKNGVASQGLRLNTRTLYGQKVVPCKVVDIDPITGKETVEYVKDKEINAFLRRCNIGPLRASLINDYVNLGTIFPMLCLNDDRSEIVTVAYDKAAKFRFSPYDNGLKRIDTVIRSANWPNPAADQMEIIACIDSGNWYYEVDRIRQDNKFKYAFPIRALDVLNDYYAKVHWIGIFLNGHLDNSNAYPQINKAIIKNMMSIRYHIEISTQYWERTYPGFAKMEKKQRDDIVNAEYKKMNDFLSGKDNQMKTFISTFGVDTNGKPMPGIVINAVDDKFKSDAWLNVAAAANAEIMFAQGVNPAIFGLGTPGGAGAGGANNGGSNIRESWLTMIAASQLDRDLIYSWWNFVCEFNGYDNDIELRTIDKVLTTLDTGAGTSKTLS